MSNKFNFFADKKIDKVKGSDVMLLTSKLANVWSDQPNHEIIKLENSILMFAPNVSSYGESNLEPADESFVLRWSQPGSKMKYFGIDNIASSTSDFRLVDYAKIDFRLLVEKKRILDLHIRCDNEHAILDKGSRFKVRRLEVIHRVDFGTVIRCWSQKLKF